MGCKAGVLVIIVKTGSGDAGGTSPPPTTTTGSTTPSVDPTTVDQTTRGTITAVTSGTITIHNTEHGDLTCSISDGSPSLVGFNVGDLAGMGCKAGVLVVIVKQS